MKRIFKTLILVSIGAYCFTSCNKEIEGNPENNPEIGKEINFVTGINNLSRTAIADGTLTTSFATNDSIGIFVYEGDNVVARNIKYVYTGSNWISDNPLTSKSGAIGFQTIL